MTAGADDGGLRFCPVSALFGGIATLIVIVSLPPNRYKDISLGWDEDRGRGKALVSRPDCGLAERPRLNRATAHILSKTTMIHSLNARRFLCKTILF